MERILTMRRIAFFGLLATATAYAGDCPDCEGRQGFLARRAAARAARHAQPSTTKVVTEQPAVIKTETIYQTRKVGEKITVVPVPAKGAK